MKRIRLSIDPDTFTILQETRVIGLHREGITCSISLNIIHDYNLGAYSELQWSHMGSEHSVTDTLSDTVYQLCNRKLTRDQWLNRGRLKKNNKDLVLCNCLPAALDAQSSSAKFTTKSSSNSCRRKRSGENRLESCSGEEVSPIHLCLLFISRENVFHHLVWVTLHVFQVVFHKYAV